MCPKHILGVPTVSTDVPLASGRNIFDVHDLSKRVRILATGVKGNRICLSGGVLLADAGTVGVEAKNLFSLFIARPGGELRCCVVLLMRELVGLSDGYQILT
jgi:hypothetical protein